ncbi:MAG: hypothetical protein K2I96_08670 [Lachnospiraceae bacterium]|nr:hypothetical protein [Lachnospiraceae bacterium]
MKNFKFKKILMMLALVIIVQNGTIIVSNTDGNTGSYTDEGGAAPCSDVPDFDENYD